MKIYHEAEEKIIPCVICGKDFEFSAAEAQFYREKGFAEPRRCKGCRATYKQKREREQQRARECHALDAKSTLGDAIKILGRDTP